MILKCFLVNCRMMEKCPPILFPSPYLSQHLSIPHSKKPPPKQISGHSSHTKNIIITFNGVPLDTFNASFVQLSEICKKFCSHSSYSQGNKHNFLLISCVCVLNPLATELFFCNFSTFCIQNLNNTETKEVSIMKQTAFWRERNGEYRECLKYSVPTFVE